MIMATTSANEPALRLGDYDRQSRNRVAQRNRSLHWITSADASRRQRPTAYIGPLNRRAESIAAVDADRFFGGG